MPPLTEEQHAIRRTGIGSSDVGAICGVDPWKTVHRVWEEKRGLTTQGKEPLPIRVGRLVEDLIAELYEEETGEVLETRDEARARGTMRDPRDGCGWILATPDRLLKSDPKALIEIKWVGWRVAKGWDTSAPDGVPDYVRCQAEWQMRVTGRERVYVPVIIDGARFHVFTVERSEKIQSAIVERARDFWERHVLGGEPPPADGSDDAKAMLQRLYPNVRAQLAAAPDDADEVASQIIGAKASIKQAEAALADAENRMRELIGSRLGFQGDGWRALWSERAGGVLWKGVAEEMAKEAGLDLAEFVERNRGAATRSLRVTDQKKKESKAA